MSATLAWLLLCHPKIATLLVYLLTVSVSISWVWSSLLFFINHLFWSMNMGSSEIKVLLNLLYLCTGFRSLLYVFGFDLTLSYHIIEVDLAMLLLALGTSVNKRDHMGLKFDINFLTNYNHCFRFHFATIFGTLRISFIVSLSGIIVNGRSTHTKAEQ